MCRLLPDFRILSTPGRATLDGRSHPIFSIFYPEKKHCFTNIFRCQYSLRTQLRYFVNCVVRWEQNTLSMFLRMCVDYREESYWKEWLHLCDEISTFLKAYPYNFWLLQPRQLDY